MALFEIVTMTDDCGMTRIVTDNLAAWVEDMGTEITGTETRTRLRLVQAGLPEPEVNPAVRLDTGQTLRVDLVWRTWKVAVEYDGPQHFTDPRQIRDPDRGPARARVADRTAADHA